MPLAENEQAEAVYIIAKDRIIREMLYSEFEAILDGYVPIPEFSNKQIKAVYARINSDLYLVAAVFFLLEFDAEGFPDRRWNIPLAQLADTAASGPDLGAGPIRLACASQCAIAWHQPQLWDPNMDSGKNNFALLKKSAKANKLGLLFKKTATVEAAPAPMDTASARAIKLQYESELRMHVAQLLKEQRFKMGLLKTQYQQQVEGLKSEHQQRLSRYQEALDNRERTLRELQQSHKLQKEKMESQMAKMEGIREYFEHKLKSAMAGEQESVQALHKQYELELQMKLESATAELEEMVQIRDMELLYRNEQEASLNEEITRLRAELQNLVGNSGNEILTRLQTQGINFVAYQPGAGHITIPVSDITQYTENPQAYAASKCGLTETQYRNWLEHYKSPNCCALKADGSVCGAPIERVHNPKDFHPGENDRCSAHSSAVPQTFALSR